MRIAALARSFSMSAAMSRYAIVRCEASCFEKRTCAAEKRRRSAAQVGSARGVGAACPSRSARGATPQPA